MLFNSSVSARIGAGVHGLAGDLACGSELRPDNGGTEYLLSSDAVFFDDGIVQRDLLVWSMSNTSAIDTAPASLSLAVKALP